MIDCRRLLGCRRRPDSELGCRRLGCRLLDCGILGCSRRLDSGLGCLRLGCRRLGYRLPDYRLLSCCRRPGGISTVELTRLLTATVVLSGLSMARRLVQRRDLLLELLALRIPGLSCAIGTYCRAVTNSRSESKDYELQYEGSCKPIAGAMSHFSFL